MSNDKDEKITKKDVANDVQNTSDNGTQINDTKSSGSNSDAKTLSKEVTSNPISIPNSSTSTSNSDSGNTLNSKTEKSNHQSQSVQDDNSNISHATLKHSSITKQKKQASSMSLGLETIKDYGSILIILGISALLIFMVIMPQYKALIKNKQDIADLNEEVQNVTNHLRYLQRLSDVQGELEENKSLAEQALPKEEDIPFFLNQIITISNTSGIDLTGLSFGGISTGKKDNVNVIMAKVSGKGLYSNVVSFLEKLESSRKIMSSDNISVNIESSKTIENNDTKLPLLTPHEDQYDISITVNSYFMKDPNTDKISIEKITSQPNYDNVLDKIKNMQYYEPTDLNIQIGTTNPFTNDAKVEIIKDDGTNETFQGFQLQENSKLDNKVSDEEKDTNSEVTVEENTTDTKNPGANSADNETVPNSN